MILLYCFLFLHFENVSVCLVDYLSTIYCRRLYEFIFIFKEFCTFFYCKTYKKFFGSVKAFDLRGINITRTVPQECTKKLFLWRGEGGITALEWIKVAFMQSDCFRIRLLIWDKRIKLTEVMHIFRYNVKDTIKAYFLLTSYVINGYIFSSIKETNWFVSEGMCVLLFDVFNGCSLVKK